MFTSIKIFSFFSVVCLLRNILFISFNLIYTKKDKVLYSNFKIQCLENLCMNLQSLKMYFLLYRSMVLYIKIDELYIQFLKLYIIRKTINKMNVVFYQFF